MIASGAPGHTTHPASCPHLAGRCTAAGDHDMHWGAANEIPAPRPVEDGQPIAVAQLFSTENEAYQESEPTLSVAFSPFDGELSLAEVDQLEAGMADFLRKLREQAVQLAAARREWEAQR
jgi:hypothetical protein